MMANPMKQPTVGGLQPGNPHAMERLVAVVQELSLTRNLDTVMRIVRRTARELTGADGATFVLREGDFCYYADEDAIAPLWKGKRFPMASCISGWVMMNRQSAVIEDIYADPRIPADAYRPTFVKSLAMVPIRTSFPIGAIGNYWATRHPATPEEVNVLQALADSASIALENVQLYTELTDRIAEMKETQVELAHQLEDMTQLHQISARISTTVALRPVLQEVTEAVAAMMNTDKGLLMLYDEEGEYLRHAASIGFDTAFLKWAERVPLGVAGPGTAIVKRRTVIIEDVETDPILAQLRDIPRLGGYRATYCFPLISPKGRIIGTLSAHFAQPHRPSERQIRLVEMLANQASQAIESARLYHEAQEEIAIRKRVEKNLLEQTRTIETIQEIGLSLTAELDLQKLVQAVTDAATELTGAEFGAFFYNFVNEKNDFYMLYTLSGAPPEAFSQFPIPRNTPLFEPTFKGERIIRLDDVTKDPRYGKNPPHHGKPKGHLPVTSYLAVPVISRSAEVLGGLFFGHSQAGVFTERHEKIIAGIAAQAAIAIDNARLYAKAEETSRLKSQFLAIVSHDLRAPLNAIMGYTDLLLEEVYGALKEDQRKPLEAVGKNVNDLLKLVNNFLDLSKIEAGKMPVDLALIDLSLLIQDVLVGMRPLLDQKSLDLQLKIDQALPTIESDPDKIKQILVNLISNAIKYTQKGGIIITLKDCPEKGRIQIAVEDTGIGIPSDALPKIFDAFHQADRKLGGFGLGLSIVKELVQVLKGEISAQSTDGVGSTFILILPYRFT